MANEVLAAWNPQSLEDLRRVLDEVVMLSEREGHHPSTVYPEKRRIALVRHTLSDGSKVLNLHFFDGDGSHG